MTHYTDVHIEILSLNASKVNNETLSTLSDLIGTGEVKDMHPAVYKRHVLGKWLVRFFLKSKGLPNDTINRIALSSLGKPYISGISSFNISHNNDMVVCAIANRGQVGIDIEHLRSLDWQGYKDCFSLLDWQQISVAQDPSSILLKYWTMKESILKADGRGLQVQLSDVVLYEKFGLIGKEEKRWYLESVPVEEGYVCHVSCEFPIQDVVVKRIEI